MAAAVFEISRPQRLSVAEKVEVDSQYYDFVQFAEKRLQQTGSCFESEVFSAFRTEIPGYRDSDHPSDATLRQFVKKWAPKSRRTANGFFKNVSLKERIDPFK